MGSAKPHHGASTPCYEPYVFDALIVGGGPAGSTCARTLTRAGARVAILDRAEFPRVKLCAGWLSPPFWDVIERAPTGLSLNQKVKLASDHWKLTPRQTEVVAQAARGLSNKEIASVLGCAEVTVENHLTAAFRRAGVDGRGQLIAVLLQGRESLKGGA